jgi:hypothetical protein
VSIVVDDIRSNLLQLDMFEKAERLRVFKDYMFYKGESSNLKAAKENPALYGQNWPVADKLDYEPTQDVRNITKKLLRKQARFMFSVPPNITLKPLKIPDMQACEDLQNHISQIFEDNNFWNATKNAFLSSTIKKRVLARIEANPGSSIVIKYEDIENFNYKEKNNKLMWVRFFQEDDNNALTDDDTKKIYYTHTYWYRVNDNKTIDVMYQKDTYSDGEYTIPHESQEQVTGFSTIPCWLIKHNEELNSTYGY